MYNIMYLGQKPIGEKCLKILSDAVGSNINISAVVSNPLKESVWWGSNAGYEYAERNRVPFISNIKRNIFVNVFPTIILIFLYLLVIIG